jgi:large subunit ribosomal protein L9e
MRYVYAHFPINVALSDGVCEIRNFLGERRVRRVSMRGLTTIEKAKAKDTLILEGIDINDVSQSGKFITLILVLFCLPGLCLCFIR